MRSSIDNRRNAARASSKFGRRGDCARTLPQGNGCAPAMTPTSKQIERAARRIRWPGHNTVPTQYNLAAHPQSPSSICDISGVALAGVAGLDGGGQGEGGRVGVHAGRATRVTFRQATNPAELRSHRLPRPPSPVRTGEGGLAQGGRMRGLPVLEVALIRHGFAATPSPARAGEGKRSARSSRPTPSAAARAFRTERLGSRFQPRPGRGRGRDAGLGGQGLAGEPAMVAPNPDGTFAREQAVGDGGRSELLRAAREPALRRVEGRTVFGIQAGPRVARTRRAPW